MTHADDFLFRGIRIIRHLETAQEAPWPGARATMPDGESRFLVDAAVLRDDWAGWASDPAGHVACALDVLRTAGGHLVVLAPFRERLADAVDRRRSAGVALTAGEVVTVTVSLLRGCAEIPEGSAGEWWLDDDARPIFADIGEGEDASTAAERLIEELNGDVPRLGRILTDAAVVLGDRRRLLRELDDIEQQLFAAAVPEPLALDVFTPRHARGLSVHDGREDATLTEPRATGIWGALARHVDADWTDAVSQVTTGLWRRLRGDTGRPSRSRGRGPLLVAGAVVAVVVGGAALLPAAADPSPLTTGPTRVTSGPTSPEPQIGDAAEGGAAEASPGQPEVAADDPPAPDDPPLDLAARVSELLGERSACGGDTACLGEVVADLATTIPPGAVDLPGDARSVTLLDDFGDVAVVRVDALDGSTDGQLVVIVRRDGKWLLRDVHDVAEQP